MNVILTLIAIIIVGWAIIKKVKPQTVLVVGGMVLMLLAYFMGYKTSFVTEKQATGTALFDMFAFIRYTLSSDISTFGLSIMCGAGFAKYMDYIGASTRLVDVSLAPLKKLNAPYLVNTLGFLICMAMSLSIQSASALSMLTMVTIYPIVTRLGVSKIGAASAIATGHLLDIGPAAATSQIISKVANVSINKFFIENQIPVYIIAGLSAAIAHYFWQRYADKKEQNQGDGAAAEINEDKVKGDAATPAGPMAYLILPVLPISLIVIFSEYVAKTIRLDIIMAMLISFSVAMIFELVRYRDFHKVAKSIEVFFQGMGHMFAVTVTLVVAAEVFANGIKAMGFIDALIGATQNSGIGAVPITLGACALIILVSVVTGSGIAAFASFAALIPGLAAGIGSDPVQMLQTMQNAASLGRLLSPVAAVIVIVAGISGLSPLLIVKRNLVPVLTAFVVTTGTVLLFF